MWQTCAWPPDQHKSSPLYLLNYVIIPDRIAALQKLYPINVLLPKPRPQRFLHDYLIIKFNCNQLIILFLLITCIISWT